jgi:hypothetical protein
MIGIIYKIKCNTTQEFYIGSSFNINERISTHKNLTHCKSRDIIKRNNYQFIILQNIETDNKKSLELYENLYIIIGWKTGRCVNTKLAYTSKKYKKWVISVKHRERHNETNRRNYHKNIEIYRELGRKNHKKYYEKNKDIIKQKAIIKGIIDKTH